MKSYSGITTALITPFYKGEVDYESLKKLINWQLQSGIFSFVVNGTTAESPTLLPKEVKKIFSFIKSEFSSQVSLILSAGSNSTYLSDQKIKTAITLGAKSVLLVCPYYNKPSQEGLVKHFQYLAQNNQSVNIFLYNVPSRTCSSLDINSLSILSKEKNIIGLKEASGDISLAKNISEKKLFSNLLSGDDFSFKDFLLAGGDGLIGVATHILGKEFKEVYSSVTTSATSSATSSATTSIKDNHKWNTYLPLLKALYSETNPVGIKKALALMGIIKSSELRLPLVESRNKINISKELKNLGLL